MSDKNSWTVKFSQGVAEVRLDGWGSFDYYIRAEMIEHPQFVWRGQADATWRLEPSLDRVLRAKGVEPDSPNDSLLTEKHLQMFKMASRGRRGLNPPVLEGENDWWALGQHNGLFTPLLDWTNSPFVAAYFAFILEPEEDVDECAVYGLSLPSVETKSNEISKRWKRDNESGRAPVVEFIQPLTDENSRLINQNGLFTRGPSGTDIEEWVRDNFSSSTSIQLVKIVIPTRDRHLALKALNRMNINHQTLFPDLHGASQYVNTGFIVSNYATRDE